MNYKRIYFQIISYRKQNPLTKEDGYIEYHHIIPRSLGGSDDESNLVALTAREHYIVHVLLYKIFKKRAENEVLKAKDLKMNALANMAAALRFMGFSTTKQHSVKMNSHLFEELRIKANNDIKEGRINSTYSIEVLKQMYEFYIVNSCSNNEQKYAELQDRFNYPYKVQSLRQLLIHNGFSIQDGLRYIQRKQLIAMYADFMTNRKQYRTKNGFEVFQEKWSFWNTKKRLTNYFAEQGLSTNNSSLDDTFNLILDIINQIEYKAQAFTQNVFKEIQELNLSKVELFTYKKIIQLI